MRRSLREWWRARRATTPETRPHPGYTVVFLHIPKTAGLSLREVMLAGTTGLPSFRILHPIEDVERLRALSNEDRAALGLVEGHLYYGVHEDLPRPCRYVTMLRDPVERVLSYYSFVREWAPHHLHERVKRERLTLADCIRIGLTVELDNFMVRALTSVRAIEVPFGDVTRAMLEEAKGHLETVAWLGLTEEFGASVDALCALFGWVRPETALINATTERLRRQALSGEDLGLILEHNRLDLELYEHGRALVAAQHSRWSTEKEELRPGRRRHLGRA